MDDSDRKRMRGGWFGLAGSIVIALITIACLRYGIAVSENGKLFAGIVLFLCAILALFSLALNGHIAVVARASKKR